MNKRVSIMILYIVVILLIIGEIAESVGRCLNYKQEESLCKKGKE